MLIGLVGHAGAGKDTAAAALVELGFVNLKFAAPLKAMASALMTAAGYPVDMVDRLIEGDLKEAPCLRLNRRSPRYVMQTLGTEWGRNLMGEDFWVEIAQRRAWETPKAVFSDCRYPNEVDMIRRNHGVIVKITRPGLVVDLSHPSEQFIASLDADEEIENDAASAEQFQDLMQIWFSAAIARNWC